jgi:hypothetical protein
MNNDPTLPDWSNMPLAELWYQHYYVQGMTDALEGHEDNRPNTDPDNYMMVAYNTGASAIMSTKRGM